MVLNPNPGRVIKKVIFQLSYIVINQFYYFKTVAPQRPQMTSSIHQGFYTTPVTTLVELCNFVTPKVSNPTKQYIPYQYRDGNVTTQTLFIADNQIFKTTFSLWTHLHLNMLIHIFKRVFNKNSVTLPIKCM